MKKTKVSTNINLNISSMKCRVVIESVLMISILVSCPNIAFAEQTLLLNLKYKSDGIVVTEIKFYGNNISTNRSSISDRFSVFVDDKPVKLSTSIYSRLQMLRSSFSSDDTSGGITKKPGSKWTCLLGGPADGQVLEALYLTYENYRIVNSQTKPVFSLALNCLFNEIYTPIKSNAREDARAVIEILNTLNIIYGKSHRWCQSLFC